MIRIRLLSCPLGIAADLLGIGQQDRSDPASALADAAEAHAIIRAMTDDPDEIARSRRRLAEAMRRFDEAQPAYAN